MRTVRLKDEAVTDLDDATWYDAQHTGLGREFIQAFNDTLRRIDQRPKAHRIILQNFRRALMTRFPHSVYVLVTDDVIVVYGVIHQRRAPSIIVERLR
jgi:ParE toxin of type II toxin-antitoxin system, parDE